MRLESRKTLERYLQEFPTQNLWRYLSPRSLSLISFLSPRALRLVRLATVWLRDGVSPRTWSTLLKYYPGLW
jgi:hypothetical protein